MSKTGTERKKEDMGKNNKEEPEKKKKKKAVSSFLVFWFKWQNQEWIMIW